MKINEIITSISLTEEFDSRTYQPPELETGDEVRVGKFKNVKAKITGFGKDKNNQPTVKTTKGTQQLFKPRIVKLMSKKVDEESLNEIDFCDETGKLPYHDSEIIFWSKEVGNIEGEEVRLFDHNSQKLFFFAPNNKISAYVIIQNTNIIGVRNVSGKGGQITALLLFILHTLKLSPLTIKSSEWLSNAGFAWIASLIAAGGRGIKITDQNNLPPDIAKLEKEWSSAKNGGNAGPTSLIFESKLNIGHQFESKLIFNGRLMKKFKYLNSRDIP